MTTGRISRLRPTAAAVLALGTLALAGCAATVAQRGNVPDAEKLEQIKLGDSKDSVVQLIGSPSTIGTFTDKRWYYISRKTEKVAFFNPTTIDQQVVEVLFDEQDKVLEVKKLNLSDAQDVDLVDRKTPTAGKTITVFDQLLGNLGRFNKNSTGRGGASGQ
jgi:outer membrane protein assembly factor BamE (lipoprotein component of BamABCDE complex)